MKKTTLSFIFLILITFNLNAQRRGVPNFRDYDFENVHFGFLLGMNQMGFCVKQNFDLLNESTPILFPSAETGLSVDSYLKSVIPSSAPGLTIGITSSFKITDNFYFRFTPAVVWGSRSIKYSIVDRTGKTLDNAADKILSQKTFNSYLIELPLILRFQGSRIQNTEPFVQAGLKYTHTLNNDEEIINKDVPDKFPLNLKKDDVYGVFGLGFNFYFDWFKMGVEGSMNYGLQDILKRSTTETMYEKGITSLKSKYFQLSVTFE